MTGAETRIFMSKFKDRDTCEDRASHLNSTVPHTYFRCINTGKRRVIDDATIHEANLYMYPKPEVKKHK
jgi:hypothetical protein